MSEPFTAENPLPRGLIIGAGVLLMFTICAVAVVRLQASAKQSNQAVVLEQSRDLRFEDRDDGSVAVLDAKNQQLVARLAPGTNGFVRGTLRGLARERRQHNEGSAQAFRLAAWSNGHLTLDDLATGRRLELGAFGPINANDFARLLKLPPTQVSLKE